MTLQSRILESEQKFEQKKLEREHYLQLAEECMAEMNKLQGEWRLLQELVNEPQEVNKEATVIDAVAEKVKK